MMTKPCSIEGCGREAHAKALCTRHWQESYAARLDGPRCEADGCNRVATCGGLCAAHYRRERRDGDPAAHRPIATFAYWSPEDDAQIARVL